MVILSVIMFESEIYTIRSAVMFEPEECLERQKEKTDGNRKYSNRGISR